MSAVQWTKLLVLSTLLTTACHKSFMGDEGSFGPVSPKLDAPKLELKEAPAEKRKLGENEIAVPCVYERSSNAKLELTLDTKAKKVVGVAMYDATKGETPDDKFQKVTTQTSTSTSQTAKFQDGTLIDLSTVLYKKSQKADILVNGLDIYNCN